MDTSVPNHHNFKEHPITAESFWDSAHLVIKHDDGTTSDLMCKEDFLHYDALINQPDSIAGQEEGKGMLVRNIVEAMAECAILGNSFTFRKEKVHALLDKFLATTPISEGKGELYRWVDGNERLPEQTWQGVVRWTDYAAWAVMSEFGFCNGNIYDFGNVFDSQPTHWLEQIPHP